MSRIENFKDSEFNCRCGKCGRGVEYMDDYFLSILEKIRIELDKPIRLTSATRCQEHNNRVSNTYNSEHVAEHTHSGKTTAVDIATPDSKYRYELLELLFKYKVPRIGINFKKNFIHVGVSKNHPNPVVFSY